MNVEQDECRHGLPINFCAQCNPEPGMDDEEEQVRRPEVSSLSYLEVLKNVINSANKRLEEGQEDEDGAKIICLLIPSKARIYELVDKDPSEREPEKRKRPQYFGKLRDALSVGLQITAYNLTEDGKHVDQLFVKFTTGRATNAVDQGEATFLLKKKKIPLKKMIEVTSDLGEGTLYDQESFNELSTEFKDQTWRIAKSLVRQLFPHSSPYLVKARRRKYR